MKVTYKNSKLEKICTNVTVAKKVYNVHMAEKIHLRIDQITAAENIDCLLQYHVGRCHRLEHDRAGQYAMDLVQPYRLVFKVKDDEIQIAVINEIIDYH